tara:strand:- start:1409 stop:2029 length:621 start_codon:yes stop_codon:yes gene_type:complete
MDGNGHVSLPSFPVGRWHKLFFCLAILAFLALPGFVTHSPYAKGMQSHDFPLVLNNGDMTWENQVSDFAKDISRAFNLDIGTSRDFSGWILEASQRHKIVPELLAGLIFAESSFRKNARSPVGAIGPAQVRPEFWAKFCGSADLEDPENNIYCGAQILSYFIEQCGELVCGLAAYNVGIYSDRKGAAKRYVAKVGRYRDRLKAAML